MRQTSRSFVRLRMIAFTGAGLVGMIVASSGCNRTLEAPPHSDEYKHMEKAHTLVMRALTSSSTFVTPASIDEIKNIVNTKLKKDFLKDLGVDDLDKALTSPRDNLPYGIVPGIDFRSAMAPNQPRPGQQGQRGSSANKPAPPTTTLPPIILYEQKGTGGKHMVARSVSGISEVDEETLKQSVPNFKP